MIRILHTADWHIDSPLRSFTEAQRRQLRASLLDVPGKIADVCLREGCDLVLLAGDVFDGIPSRDTVNLVKKELERCGVPVLVSPGNHDFCVPGSPWLEENWPENVFIFTGARESVTISGLNCRIYGGGFRSMDCEAMLEDFQADGEETYKIGIFHGDPTQKNSPYNPITAAQVRSSGLQYLALGHIHKAGTFRAGATLCAWPGCPMGRGWDEVGDKGVCIVTLGETAQVQALSLDTVRFHTLEVDTGIDALGALEAALPALGSSDFYRVTLTGCTQVDVEDLQEKLSRFPNLELWDETEDPMAVWEDAGEDTLEGVYFRMLRNAMEEDPKNAARILLAAEISRRLLDGKEVAL